jgi:hypothetical protein
MNMSRHPFKIILLLMSLGMPFTVCADAASDTVAAIAADPTHAAEITAAAVTAAVAANPDQGAAIAAAIVSAAITANPYQAVAITTAVITANPDLAPAITAAAVAAAPTQAAAIGAAAIAAAPNQETAIVSSFVAAVGALTPTENVSEQTTNNIAMETSEVISAIVTAQNACAPSDTLCKTAAAQSILAQVAAQSSSPAAVAAIKKEVESQVSPN